jgi:hypothetical protein
MNWLKKNILAVFGGIVALAGIPVGIAMTWAWQVAAGIALAFVLFGLFIYCLGGNAKISRRVGAVLILCFGLVASLLIAYRMHGSVASVWRWNSANGSTVIALYVKPHLEMNTLTVLYMIFFTLAMSLHFLDGKKPQPAG